MWAKIIGGILMLSGGAFLISPERLRKKLQKKTLRTLKRYLFAAACFVGALLVSAGWKQEGILPKVLVGAGILAFFEAVFFLKAKSADIVAAWLVRLPAIYFRLYAVCQILVGAAIAFWLKR